MKNVVSMELKLEAFGAFFWSLDCYRNRCCFKVQMLKSQNVPLNLSTENICTAREKEDQILVTKNLT